MEPQTRIRAIGRSLWIVLLVLLFLSIPLLFWERSGSDLSDRILLVFCILTVCPYCVYRLCHDVYITSEGIECCRFGSVIRVLPWSQVSQACIARDYRFSAKISGTPPHHHHAPGLSCLLREGMDRHTVSVHLPRSDGLDRSL